MEKIKPCPFCGSNFMSGVYICSRWRKGTANRKMYWITCGKCRVEQRHGNSDGYRTIENAIKAWNRRPADAVPVTRCRDCKHRQVKLGDGYGNAVVLCKDGLWRDMEFFCADGERSEEWTL